MRRYHVFRMRPYWAIHDRINNRWVHRDNGTVELFHTKYEAQMYSNALERKRDKMKFNISMILRAVDVEFDLDELQVQEDETPAEAVDRLLAEDDDFFDLIITRAVSTELSQVRVAIPLHPMADIS